LNILGFNFNVYGMDWKVKGIWRFALLKKTSLPQSTTELAVIENLITTLLRMQVCCKFIFFWQCTTLAVIVLIIVYNPRKQQQQSTIIEKEFVLKNLDYIGIAGCQICPTLTRCARMAGFQGRAK